MTQLLRKTKGFFGINLDITNMAVILIVNFQFIHGFSHLFLSWILLKIFHIVRVIMVVSDRFLLFILKNFLNSFSAAFLYLCEMVQVVSSDFEKICLSLAIWINGIKNILVSAQIIIDDIAASN